MSGLELRQSGEIVRDTKQIVDTTEAVNECIKATKRETAELENLDKRLGVLENTMSDRRKVANRVRDKIQRVDTELL